MPCWGMRETTQSLTNVKDIKILGMALEEMGLTVTITGQSLTFRGRATGSYEDGILKSRDGFDLSLLAKYTAVANIKRQIEINNNDKYKKTKLKLTKQGEFNYLVSKL